MDDKEEWGCCTWYATVIAILQKCEVASTTTASQEEGAGVGIFMGDVGAHG